jgi:hypothetical protein
VTATCTRSNGGSSRCDSSARIPARASHR